jgi:hypothetical protein
MRTDAGQGGREGGGSGAQRRAMHGGTAQERTRGVGGILVHARGRSVCGDDRQLVAAHPSAGMRCLGIRRWADADARVPSSGADVAGVSQVLVQMWQA